VTNRGVASSPRLDVYRAEGISHFMLWLMDAPHGDGMEPFAESIVRRYR
jgi:hypothetical protein